MKINISHLLTQPESTTETHQISLSNLKLSDDSTANIVGTITLTVLDDFILANINGKSDITLPCHRCLKPTTLDITLDFSSQFYTQINPEIEGYPIADGQIDLITPITDEIIASLPITVLCQDNCHGLCPICGHNLNDNPCKCDKVEFEVLNKIRFEHGSSAKTEN
ncbi:MAG: DUF177 domain-containing protein [Patescibacteria group bacterium]